MQKRLGIGVEAYGLIFYDRQRLPADSFKDLC